MPKKNIMSMNIFDWLYTKPTSKDAGYNLVFPSYLSTTQHLVTKFEHKPDKNKKTGNYGVFLNYL